MPSLRLTQKDISDRNFYKLSTLGCLPAIDWLYYRSTKYSGKKKEEVSKLIKKVKIQYKNKDIEYPFTSYSFDRLKQNKIFQWHPFLLELPISSLIHPLNGISLNNKIIRSARQGRKINTLVTPINFKKVKLDDNYILPAELGRLITSLILLNWEFKQPFRQRPNEAYLSYFAKDDLFLEQDERYEKIIDRFKRYSLNEDQIRFILFYVSKELVHTLRSLSNTSIGSIRRLVQAGSAIISNYRDADIIKLTPSYSLLKEDSFENIITLEKFSLMGYKKIAHLQFLENEIIQCLLDDEFLNILNEIDRSI